MGELFFKRAIYSFYYFVNLSNCFNCCIMKEKLYVENVGATIIVLRKLSTEWRNYSAKISPDTLKVTLKHLRAKVSIATIKYF